MGKAIKKSYFDIEAMHWFEGREISKTTLEDISKLIKEWFELGQKSISVANDLEDENWYNVEVINLKNKSILYEGNPSGEEYDNRLKFIEFVGHLVDDGKI